ncbi:hypothetical protein LTR85_000192 [Meristemomyces frigidus]|nr:hypothetical protein LTR85_000192 [Meristemomyces frigidus]
MAATQYSAMTGRPAVKTEQFDMDSLFDFNQGTTQPSPATASSSRVDALSPFDKHEERQQFNGPSHDYHQYKQQVGLPVGSMANMPMSQSQMFEGYSSGIGDMGFDGGFNGWNSGIDMDSEMSMDFNNPQSAMPAMFFPPQTESSTENFVNPNTIGGQEEAPSSVGRLWPGMHSQQAQQAAMQKAAQTQAMQQRQMKLQSQQAQYRQVGNGSHSQVPSSSSSQAGHGKRASHASEPHVEESISRLLNQMRQNSGVSDMDEGDSPGGLLPHIARMKKDEEEMDEDERLLASDEGKKLSSKERRQLRNKVSARAFRSRRKEYIGQLEGEVAMKAQEANGLRTENAALMQENDRYRGLIETLLRHPAFTPFINDISKDPSVLGMPQQQQRMQPQQQQLQQPPVSHPTPQPQQQQQQQQDSKPEYMNFDASQLHVPSQQQPEQQQQQIGLAMIPEENFSKLNINGYRPSMNFNSFQSVNAYAVTDVPRPDPVRLLAESLIRLPALATSTITASSTDHSAAFSSTSDMTVLLAKLDGTASRMRCA